MFLLLSLYVFRFLELGFLIRISCWILKLSDDLKETVQQESLVSSSGAPIGEENEPINKSEHK